MLVNKYRKANDSIQGHSRRGEHSARKFSCKTVDSVFYFQRPAWHSLNREVGQSHAIWWAGWRIVAKERQNSNDGREIMGHVLHGRLGNRSVVILLWWRVKGSGTGVYELCPWKSCVKRIAEQEFVRGAWRLRYLQN